MSEKERGLGFSEFQALYSYLGFGMGLVVIESGLRPGPILFMLSFHLLLCAFVMRLPCFHLVGNHGYGNGISFIFHFSVFLGCK